MRKERGKPAFLTWRLLISSVQALEECISPEASDTQLR